MKFYISRVLGNEVLLLNEILINDADILFPFYFIKFVISGRDVTKTKIFPLPSGCVNRLQYQG